MIDLGIRDIDGAVIDGLTRVVRDGEGPGWRTTADGRCELDAELWRKLTELTVWEGAAGDEDAPNFLSLELAAEQLGEALVGLPLIDHLVGLRTLEQLGASREWDAVVGSGLPVALLTPAIQASTAQPPLSLSGAVAGHVLRIIPEGAIDIRAQDPADRPNYVPNVGELPVGRMEQGDGWTRLADGRPDIAGSAAAERKTLVSGALAGMARRAIALGVDYANQRELFGTPIGAFQSLAHGLSTAKVLADGAELLAREAAWARDSAPESFEIYARMAYAFGALAGDKATRTAVHVFGGYGVTRDYPAQAYFRTARALSLFIGDRRLDLQVIGRNLLQGAA